MTGRWTWNVYEWMYWQYRSFWVWISGVNCTGFVDGDWLWVLSLGRQTGDGKSGGETFWEGCGWFFLGGSGEGKRKRLDTYCWSSRTVSPILDALDRHVFCWSFDNLTTSFTHCRQWRDCYTSFRHLLHGALGMVSYSHTVYVTMYFCYMFRFRTDRVVSYMLFNEHLCMYIILLWTGGGT